MEPQTQERLRLLPSTDEVAAELDGAPHAAAVRAARAAIDDLRRRVLAGEAPDISLDAVRADAAQRLRTSQRGSLVAVINATGVILHTNLGRAPLAAEAQDAVAAAAAGYSSLELELSSGARSSRHDHVAPLVTELTGAAAAIAVNNNAAAVLLALAAHARGRRVLVARGELIEIGGSFRVPEILEQSGAELVEVGTANRTRIEDFAAALDERTAAILRVHQSNFRMVGFTSEASPPELAELARHSGVLFIHDLGSGATQPVGDEPTVRAAARSADLVCFSADKLLGGPQAGILAGTEAAIDACRSHPLARALRLDKLQLAALAATLRLHVDDRTEAIPALAMLSANPAELDSRAEALAAAIGPAAAVRGDTARVGGGSLPTAELPGPVCAVDPGEAGAEALAERLRLGDPPVIARIAGGNVILDPRTIAAGEVEECAACARSALGRP
jgi:L-seryl-tRNA(Ser) seleniumtransferase